MTSQLINGEGVTKKILLKTFGRKIGQKLHSVFPGNIFSQKKNQTGFPGNVPAKNMKVKSRAKKIEIKTSICPKLILKLENRFSSIFFPN